MTHNILEKNPTKTQHKTTKNKKTKTTTTKQLLKHL
jgi:hypothetical protein